MSEDRGERAAMKAEQERNDELARFASEAPKPPTGKARAAYGEWRQQLEETMLWRLLTAGEELEYRENGFEGTEAMSNVRKGQLANAAEVILEGRVRRVVTSTQPHLHVTVEV